MKKLFLVALVCFFAVLGARTYLVHKAQQRQAQKQTKAPSATIAIIEGWTADEIAAYLQKNNLVLKADFLNAEKNFDTAAYPLLESKPQNQDLEGFLFPDTYFITPGKTVADKSVSQAIIKKLLDNFSEKFTPQMQTQARARGMSVYQILTLASIIEKETGRNAVTQEQKDALASERKIIAGIFYNRLNSGQPLQSDATINFITKKNNPAPFSEDLQVKSPYNTYLHAGLPPGPICNPSLSSITAALYPAKTDYFYFLHKQPSGEAVYSETYEQHLMNKQKYLK